MKNLDSALTGKKLDDLRVAKAAGGSNLIEPTKAEIELMVAALKDGKSYQEVKKAIRRVVGDARPGFSTAQIKEIDEARMTKVAALTPKPILEEEVV